MKKSNRFLICFGRMSFLPLLLLLFALTSCKEFAPINQPAEDGESKSNQTVQSSDRSELPSDSTEESQSSGSNNDNACQIVIADGWLSYPFYPGRMNDEYHYSGGGLSEQGTVFPDTLDSYSGKIDSYDGHNLYVAALDQTFSIPEGCFAYQLTGKYWDCTKSQSVDLQFVREYVFTSQQVSEEDLIQDMEAYFKNEFASESAYYRGPSYVVYSVRVFRKEYLPIENLFTSLLANSGEYFSCGDYYISLGKRDLWSKAPITKDYTYPSEQWLKAIKENAEPTGLVSESIWEEPMTSDGGYLWGSTPSMFRTGTAGAYLSLPYEWGGNTMMQVSSVAASVFSDEWWETYQNALKELKENPEKYRYGELIIDFSSLFNDKLEPNKWYLDDAETAELRAYLYANLAVFYSEEHPLALERIVLALRKLENGRRLYAAFLNEDADLLSPSKLTYLETNWDALAEIDLSFSREYITNKTN